MSRARKRIPGRGTSTSEDPARETAWGLTAPRRLGRGELREVQEEAGRGWGVEGGEGRGGVELCVGPRLGIELVSPNSRKTNGSSAKVSGCPTLQDTPLLPLAAGLFPPLAGDAGAGHLPECCR